MVSGMVTLFVFYHCFVDSYHLLLLYACIVIVNSIFNSQLNACWLQAIIVKKMGWRLYKGLKFDLSNAFNEALVT